MATGRRGRPQVSSRAQVEAAAFELFLERGYAETSIMDIVAAAGISKTTFFRYFSSKAALVWFPFEESTRDLQSAFDTVGDEVPVMEAIRAGVIDTVAARLDDEGVWTARFGSSTPHRNSRPRVRNGVGVVRGRLDVRCVPCRYASGGGGAGCCRGCGAVRGARRPARGSEVSRIPQ